MKWVLAEQYFAQLRAAERIDLELRKRLLAEGWTQVGPDEWVKDESTKTKEEPKNEL